MPPPRKRPYSEYHHCGPFNTVSNKRSRNAVDEACRQHDISYGNIGPKAYFYHNKADDKFIRRMGGREGFRPWFYGSVFKLKKKIAPVLPKKNMPPRRRATVRSRTRRPAVRRTRRTRRPRRAIRRPIYKSRSRRMKSSNTKSRSFIYAPRRRWQTNRRQYRISKMQNLGVIMTKETGLSTVNGPAQSIICGHGTFPYRSIAELLYRLLIKRLFMKANIQVRNFTDIINTSDGPLFPNDIIRLSYKQNYGTATTVSQLDFSVDATINPESWDDIISHYHTTLGNGTRNQNFIRIEYIPYASGVSRQALELIGATIYMDFKSTFKMQNQTPGSNAESDVVNNVPIMGKFYEGNGTGTNTFRNGAVEQQFIINDVHGSYVNPIDTALVYTGLSEPPPPGYFTNVKKFGKVHLDAGQLKTSVLTYKRRILLNKLCEIIYGNEASHDDLKPNGKFRFFHWEHMLKSSTSVSDLSIAMEHNLRMAMSMKVSKTFYTDEYVENDYVTY